LNEDEVRPAFEDKRVVKLGEEWYDYADKNNQLLGINFIDEFELSPKFRLVEVGLNRQEEKKILEELLIDLRNSGIYGNDVVILSRYAISNSQNCLHQSLLSRNAGILKTTGQMWLAKKNEVRFSTISSFKGLEANVVIIYDMDSFSSQTARMLNYVGISRACSKLYVLYSKECENERQEMISNFYKKL